MSNITQSMSMLMSIAKHMIEEKKRINAYVPADLHEQVVSKGYSTITEAIIRGFEKLLIDEESTNTKEDSKEPNNGVEIELRARVESLEGQLKVKDSQISELTATMQAQAVQVQTMIQQKAIEAPGAKKPWWQFW